VTQGWTIQATDNTERVVNGDFTASTGWVTGTGWAIASGKATATAASGALSRADVTVAIGQWYRLSYQIANRTAGSITVSCGGVSDVPRSANGTYTIDFYATSTASLSIAASTASLDLDNVSVKDGDSITFYEPPVAGVNNITVTEYAASSINATSIFKIGAWNGEYGYPKEIEFFADRLVMANTAAQPQTLWLSRIGDYSMFGKSTPIADDDAITATLNARQQNAIGDLLPKQHLLAGTTGGIWKCAGADSEVLTPSTFSARPQPAAGASPDLPALDIGETAIYYAFKGAQVRDLSFAFETDGYAGSDLTAFASHLLENRRLLDWCWQSVPYSCAYAVRDDGVLLSMTYKREHQVVAWARQLLAGGIVESVCSVPEDGIEAVYVIVRRTINGATVRYVERFASPPGLDWRETIGVDCSLTYDGRNQPTTLTLSGGATVDSLVTVTASGNVFGPSNVGDAVVLGYNDAINGIEPTTITISTYVSPTQVTGYPSRPMTATSAAGWAFAQDTMSGLSHLEGQTVRLAFDGYDGGTAVVTGGAVTLPQPGVLVHVGLTVCSDFESLDLMLLGQESVANRNKIIRSVGLLMRNARVCKVGPNFTTMEVVQERDNTLPMGVPPARINDWRRFNVTGNWGAKARVCVRCDDPYGASILAIEPEVDVGR
jgi:hypothetical protein